MPWYVFALVDEPPAMRLGRGLRGPLAARRLPGGFAIVERRADVPPAAFGTLRTHDAVVTRLAAAVPAILPVRFGTLLELEDMQETLADREPDIVEAFDRVRGRVQFTWRAQGAGRLTLEARRAKAAAQGGAGAPGADYLRRAAAKAAPPAAFRAVREKLRPLLAAERYQAATASLPNSLYHLVDRASVSRYRLIARTLASANPALRLSGPFPPFAFTPELL
jgi:gas vesicle protein GvpL/GvpF